MMGTDPVIASLAPSFVANYEGIGIESMREALKKIGFTDTEETAIGATMVKKEYERILAEGSQDVVISSACHSVNLLIQKYFPAELPFLADVMSPMQAHAADIKRRIPNAKVVFIGPCVAKKDEADTYKDVDAVMTFEELTGWFEKVHVTPEQKLDETPNSLARLFPTPGGIIRTMNIKALGYTFLSVDGVENCMAALRDIEEGKLHKCFIEMSACVGGCVGGPVMEKNRRSPIRGYLAVSDYAGDKDFEVAHPDPDLLRKRFDFIPRNTVMPSEVEIADILRQMGKTKPADELNCGSCGYDTCREKAIAIFQGKAEISMCLPFLKDRAENFSDTIIKIPPTAYSF
jgi:iron only hydrogenase large subunit-like protein